MIEETCGPLTMMTSPLPLRWSTMYWQASAPALTLSVMTVTSAPGAATSKAATITPALWARFTAGAIAFASTALSMRMLTPAAMKLSICENCLLRS